MKTPDKNVLKRYWKENIRYVLILLSVWFTVSYGFGLILSNTLNQLKIGGFKLGFWFAQQGSIITFVLIIFAYVAIMNHLDKKFNVNEE